MSFNKLKSTIEEGDTVILYLNPSSLHAITVNPLTKNKKDAVVENILQTTQGGLKIKSLIGKEYGSRIQLTRGFGYALHPTPELWTITLPHRTQIIYTPDISMIVFQLELRPGSVVIESVLFSAQWTVGSYEFVMLLKVTEGPGQALLVDHLRLCQASVLFVTHYW
ncbi:hypothetical protein FOCC_FOCC013575 [Frankliniella occidentalis]|nr:hypothetical protein FOCC_FOCC013575 [Frankliniella occidentalis]